MEYALITSAAIIAIVLIIVFVIYSRKKTSLNNDNIRNANNSAPVTSGKLAVDQGSEIYIPIVQLPATTEIDEKSLFEITDRTVIARISDTIPNAAQAISKTVTNKALKNVELFKLDIPSAALTKSKEVNGAFRAFSRNKNRISKNANLVKVDPSKITKASMIANSVANIINVGSLVVGQYYMSEISAKLEAMNNTVNKISNFQDREFKSRILSLIARVGKISQFSSEVLENDEQRNIKLTTLEDLEGDVTELLGQVNLTITDTTQKSPNPTYKDYQAKVDDFNTLVEYQNILVAVLEEICKLTYLLGKGIISSEMCYSLYNKFLEQSIQVRNVLEEWHERQVTALKIDLDKNRKPKSGVEGLVSALPALIDDKWKYKELKEGLVHKISIQAKTNLKIINEPKTFYDESIQIIIKDGKYYYLAGEIIEHK